MFRSRRSVSLRQLWKQRCITPGARGPGEGPLPASEELQSPLRPAAHQLFLKLKDEQLWRLAQAVESRGRWDCGCLWLPWEAARAGKMGPHVLLCKLYRWPDLRGPTELKRLPHCHDFWRKGPEGTRICCNPHHYSRLAPPAAATARDLPRSQSTPGQCASGCSPRGVCDTTLSRGSRRDGHWCKLAYWEHRSRVGHLYSVTEPSIHVFHNVPKGDGLCLGFLGPESGSGAVRRTRRKIGRGLVLSREQEEVWAYNLSDHPIFITSPTMAFTSARGQAAHKLLPGNAIKVFDAEQAARISGGSALGEGPCDPHSVRISFAKGWGGSYSRQYITSCPCWLEILLCTP